MTGGLDQYRSKRDFRRTREPSGRQQPPHRQGEPRFVIQKHAARSLHYDLRLEVGGVLKSWAVPKGPSTDPREKRLAVEVEDHPIDYADFEGVIGSGYGAGQVIVWDTGTYRGLTEGPIEKALEQGHLSFWLEGQKLRGGWTLQRTRAGAKPQWLFIKRRDEGADARRNPVNTQPQSVRSGRTIEDIAEGRS
ncbi:MAG TPA: DNA polymerase ligase N-terminal domain-containing protein [Gaiellales bacterium]|jgi:DNA ligase D-like protein (predicted 3'-phosphoesterase)|nr:DNA polymerase ligase N-terminal domain-containing protein [Gaiellales bacterium]